LFFKKEGKGANSWEENALPKNIDISPDQLMERKEFMQFLDKTLLEFHQNTQLLSEEELSPEKISQLKSTVNQCIK
jgi:hypothetical protein